VYSIPDQYLPVLRREESAARRRKLRLQALFSLLVVIVASLISWLGKPYLQERWHWFAIERPYMLVQFDDHVRTGEAERGLKPGDSFRECARDCPEMVVVPAGGFSMGDPIEKDERPPRR